MGKRGKRCNPRETISEKLLLYFLVADIYFSPGL